MTTEKKSGTELKVGDVVADVLGYPGGSRLAKLDLYNAPPNSALGEYVYAVGTFIPGGRISICHGDVWTVLS